jgi:hypothetical protein
VEGERKGRRKIRGVGRREKERGRKCGEGKRGEEEMKNIRRKGDQGRKNVVEGEEGRQRVAGRREGTEGRREVAERRR